MIYQVLRKKLVCFFFFTFRDSESSLDFMFSTWPAPLVLRRGGVSRWWMSFVPWCMEACPQLCVSWSGHFNIIVALVLYHCDSQLSIFLGLLISGGYDDAGRLTDVEVWSPSTGQHCTVSSLPTGRGFHTQEGSQVCGGYGSDTRTSCLTLTAGGSWERTTTLLEAR